MNEKVVQHYQHVFDAVALDLLKGEISVSEIEVQQKYMFETVIITGYVNRAKVTIEFDK